MAIDEVWHDRTTAEVIRIRFFCISKTLRTTVMVNIFQKAAEAESQYYQLLQAKSKQRPGLKLLMMCDHHSSFKNSRRIKSKPS